MSKLSYIFMTIIAFSGLAGCGSVGDETPASLSAFKESFALASIVEANEGYLLPGPRVLSGTEAGPREPFIQSQEAMTIQVDPTNISPFMEAIISDINEAITSSGAEYLGWGGGFSPDPSAMKHFSISYGEDGLYGVINVWGIPGEGTNYHLITLITEG